MEFQGNNTLGQFANPSSEERFAARLFHLAQLIDKYYTPLLCLLGALGNSLSLIVFCNDAKYRSQSAPYYLSALAISDTGFLLNLFAVWLEGIYGGVITSKVTCPLVMYLGQVTCFISVYLVVAFSVERYVAVHYPFSRPRICTRSKAKKVIALLILVALLLFSYVWIIAQVMELDPSFHYENQPQQEEYNDRYNTGHYYDDWFNSAENFVNSTGISTKRTRNEFNPKSQTILVSRENFSRLLEMEKSFQQTIHHLTSLNGIKSEVYHENGSFVPGDLSTHRSNPTQQAHLTSLHLVCTVPPKYYRISEIANYVDSVITLVVPFTLITFFNLRIAICIWKINNQRENIVGASYTSGSGVGLAGSNNKLSGGSGNELESCSNSHSNSDSSMKKRDSTVSCRHHSRHPSRSSQYKTQLLYTDGSPDKKRKERKQKVNKCDKESKTESYIKYKKCDRQSRQSYATSVDLPLADDKLEGGAGKIEEDASSSMLAPPLQTPSISPKNRMKLVSNVQVKSLESHHHTLASSETRVTKTLLLISCMFLLLNLPAHMLRCAQFIQSLTGTEEGKEIIVAALPWTNILFNTNFAVNFLLYCASGRNFRKSLWNLTLKVFRRRNRASTPVHSMAYNNGGRTAVAAVALNVVPPPQKRKGRFVNIKVKLKTANLERERIRLEEQRVGLAGKGSISVAANQAHNLNEIELESMTETMPGECSSFYSTYIGNEIKVNV